MAFSGDESVFFQEQLKKIKSLLSKRRDTLERRGLFLSCFMTVFVPEIFSSKYVETVDLFSECVDIF